MAIALILAVVVGVLYLRPQLPERSGGAPELPPSGPGDLLSVTFADAERGAITLGWPDHSPASFVTTDGGRSWRRSAHVLYLGRSVAIQWAEGGGSDRLSPDAGRTWRSLAEPKPGALTRRAPAFVDPSYGWWIVNEGMSGDDSLSDSLWWTTDRGRTWRRLPGTGIPEDASLVQVQFVDRRAGVLAVTTPGHRLTLLSTMDGGRTWRAAATPASPFAGQLTADVALLANGSRLVAWVTSLPPDARSDGSLLMFVPQLGGHHFLVTSGDGGQTWSAPVPSPAIPEPPLALPAWDAQGRFLLLDDDRLWVSPDAGSTWTATRIEVPTGLTPLVVIPAGADLVATALSADLHESALLRSSDGGLHWSLVGLPRL
jgi:photosystem II stability/assembly factor-like uncharacterized protein